MNLAHGRDPKLDVASMAGGGNAVLPAGVEYHQRACPHDLPFFWVMQVEATGQQLLEQLLGRWGLRRELGILQGLFLLARPWLDAFAAGLFDRLKEGRSLADLPPYELTSMAQASLAASCQPGEACPDPEAMSGMPWLKLEPTVRATRYQVFSVICSIIMTLFQATHALWSCSILPRPCPDPEAIPGAFGLHS